MADNVTIPATGSGSATPVIATDDAGAGGHVQIVKLAISTDASATVIPADAGNGLDVDVTRLNDGGNSITVDAPAGTPVAVRQSDGAAAQTFAELDLDTGVGTVNRISVGIAAAASGGPVAVQGDAANGLDVDVTRLPALVAGTANIGDVDIASGPTGASALQVQGTVANGSAVANNPLQCAGRDNAGNVRLFDVNTGGALAVGDRTGVGADGVSNSTAHVFYSNGGYGNWTPTGGMLYNGTTWDRHRGNTTGASCIGGLAHDAANAAGNNPQVVGAEAIAHGTNPTAACPAAALALASLASGRTAKTCASPAAFPPAGASTWW